jgi:hypothetical protein
LFLKQFLVIINEQGAHYIIEWWVKGHAHHVALIIWAINREPEVVCYVFTVSKMPLLVRWVPERCEKIIEESQ